MKKYKDLLDQLGMSNCKGYCYYKLFFEIMQFDPRTLIQTKCIEIYKWEESEKEGKDIGDNESIRRWIDSGCAKIFADIYMETENDDIDVVDIYKMTIAGSKKCVITKKI